MSGFFKSHKLLMERMLSYTTSDNNNKPKQAPFAMISPLSTDKNSFSPDLIDALIGIKPAPQVLFGEIKNRHNYINNVCDYQHPESHDDIKGTPYKLFSRYVSVLVKAGLLVRLKRDHQRELGLPKKERVTYFMLNPYYVRCKEYALANSIWSAYP